MSKKKAAQLPLVPEAPPEQEFTDMPLDELLADRGGIKLIGPPPDLSFIESVRKWGVLTPIAVKHRPRGTGWAMVDGFRRLRAVAILRNGDPPEEWVGDPADWKALWDTIPAFVVKTDGWHPDVMPVILNHQRSENYAVTLLSIEELVKEGRSEKEVYEATGVPIATIRRLMRLTGLHKELKGAFIAGQIVTAVAISAAKCTTEQQDDLARTYHATGQLAMSDVTAVKKADRRAAQMALAGMEAADAGDVWLDEVIRKLREALDLVPEEHTDLRYELRGVIDTFEVLASAEAHRQPAGEEDEDGIESDSAVV